MLISRRRSITSIDIDWASIDTILLILSHLDRPALVKSIALIISGWPISSPFVKPAHQRQQDTYLLSDHTWEEVDEIGNVWCCEAHWTVINFARTNGQTNEQRALLSDLSKRLASVLRSGVYSATVHLSESSMAWAEGLLVPWRWTVF